MYKAHHKPPIEYGKKSNFHKEDKFFKRVGWNKSEVIYVRECSQCGHRWVLDDDVLFSKMCLLCH
jgi:hypothetical protein